MHTIHELLEAVATKLGAAKCGDTADALGLPPNCRRGPSVARWTRGVLIPGDQYAVPLAQTLEVDVAYVTACLIVARGRDKDLAYWSRQASREFHAAAIDSVNVLLEQVADHREREGRERLLLAENIRTRARSMSVDG